MIARIIGCIIAAIFTFSSYVNTAGAAEKVDGVFKRNVLSEALIKNKGPRNVSLNFNGVPLNDALLSLARQASVSITIDREIDYSKVKVTAYYEGDSFEEAAEAIISGLDYAYKKVGDGAYVVTPYEETVLNVYDVFIKKRESLSPTSGSNSTPATNTSGISGGGLMGAGSPVAAPSSSSSSSNSSDKTEEREMPKIIDSIKKMLSPKGVATPMTSGFIYVRDIPSRVKMVREMLATDVQKRKTITMRINLVRIDYKDEYETGVNWAAVMNNAKAPSIAMNLDFIEALPRTNVATITVSDMDFTGVMKMLETYGDVHIVQSWESRAVSGAVLPFEMSQTLWYTTGTTVQVIGEQTVNSTQVAPMDIGLKLTINPMKLDTGYLVNTSIDLSNFIEFQFIDKMQLPQVERNFVSIPIKMSVGEMVSISGFKIKSSDKKRIGIPILSKLPILGYLFGYTSAKDKTSELSVLISFVEEKQDKET